MGELLEIVKTLVSPTEKLLDIVESGVGTIYQPRHVRKMADAKAYEIDKISESLRNNSDVLITYEKGAVIANSPEFEDFVKRTQHRLFCQELRNQSNIEAVIDNAYTELELESDVSTDPVDDDWISRFFSIIKDVNNEEMQFVWGKILAGEIKCPGSFSLRTLETIRNLSQKEAETFQKILPFVIEGDGNMFVTSKSSIRNKYGITYEDIMLLDECGLIISNGTVSLTITISEDSIIAHNTQYALLTEGLIGEKNFSFGIYSLTNAGNELLNILEHKPNNAYFNDFAEEVFKENCHSKLKIQVIESINDNKIRTTGETVREFCVSQKR